jgi:hypothetical protein
MQQAGMERRDPRECLVEVDARKAGAQRRMRCRHVKQTHVSLPVRASPERRILIWLSPQVLKRILKVRKASEAE